jgi:hypothetical protein
MSSGISGVMAALKAEALLVDSQLFEQIRRLCADLQYSTADGKLAFDDYYQTLVEAIDAIPRLELENDVSPGTETTYTIQLTQAAEQIIDECDRISRRLNQFEGKLREAERKVNNQKAEFVAWYMVAGSKLISDLEDVKLPSGDLRKLAEAEFSRLCGALDVALVSLIDAVKIETAKVGQHKAAQKEKYNLGKDQANASWTSALPAFNSAVSSERPDMVAAQVEDEDIPDVVRKPPNMIGDTLRILKPEDGIKGTFAKTGDPKPVVPVADDAKPLSPRKRLVFDDEDEVV